MMTEQEMRTMLAEKAMSDEAFRAGVIEDPKGAIEQALDVTIPEGFSFEVHEETATTYHIVLPPPSELGSDELGQVAGGDSGHWAWENKHD